MVQKMTLTAYLAQRGKKAKALTRGEAELLDIPFPLQAGWSRRYGALEIEEVMLIQLVACVEGARRVAEERCQQSRVRMASAAPADGEMRRRAAVPSKTKMIAGFVLCQARRYRSRSSAPWA